MTEEGTNALVEISKAEQALQRAGDIHEILVLRDQAAAYKVLADARGFQEAAQKAKVFQLKAERKAGEWLRENVNHDGGKPKLLQDVTVSQSLPEGVSRIESHRWQLEASVPEEVFNEWVDECQEKNKEITAAELQSMGKALKTGAQPHVSFNSGENEWYTPPEYIQAARAVMGDIDLDPASSEIAQEHIGARDYYTIEDDGLIQKWAGRVWMNPPYSVELIGKFCSKLATHVSNGDITQAIVLVNNATETSWFNALIEMASAVCFPRGRIRFIDVNGKPSGAPLQGQAILYMGKDAASFIGEFGRFGWTALVAHQNSHNN